MESMFYSEKYMLQHKDEFEMIEFGDVENPDQNIGYYRAIFNGRYSNCDTKANTKEGWIEVIVYNGVNEPYIAKDSIGGLMAARAILCGDVIIFKVDPETRQPIRKG